MYHWYNFSFSQLWRATEKNAAIYNKWLSLEFWYVWFGPSGDWAISDELPSTYWYYGKVFKLRNAYQGMTIRQIWQKFGGCSTDMTEGTGLTMFLEHHPVVEIYEWEGGAYVLSKVPPAKIPIIEVTKECGKRHLELGTGSTGEKKWVSLKKKQFDTEADMIKRVREYLSWAPQAFPFLCSCEAA